MAVDSSSDSSDSDDEDENSDRILFDRAIRSNRHYPRLRVVGDSHCFSSTQRIQGVRTTLITPDNPDHP